MRRARSKRVTGSSVCTTASAVCRPTPGWVRSRTTRASVGLDVLGIDAVVADHGSGHHDDLAEIGGVGEHLLVAGQVRRDDNFGVRGLERDGRGSGKPSSVLEQHVGRGTLSDGAVSGRRVEAEAPAEVASAVAWTAAAAARAARAPVAAQWHRSPNAARWSAPT